jgi:hypothetical protein
MRKSNVRKLIIKNPKLNLINNLNAMLQDTKFIINQNENNNHNSKENKKLVNEINNIFISKSNCSKFNFHPLINYSIDNTEDYSLYFNSIFVEISHYKKDKIIKIERTFFHPNAQSFAVNFQNLTFVFYMYYNKVKIYLNLKEYLIIFASSDLKKIRENFIDLDSKKNNNQDNSINSLKINPFDNLKEKILCFSCIKNEEIIEVKFGYYPIYLDGFYEINLPISLPFYNNKEILLEKNSLILFEINNNCSVEGMKKIINDKIQIFKILEISAKTIYYFGIIIERENINENINKNLTYYQNKNFKIYILEINNDFLGQKIPEITETKNNDYPKRVNSKKRKSTFDINQSMNLDSKTNNLLDQSMTNSHIINDSTMSINTTPTQLQKEINKIENNKEKKISKKTLQRQISYFSIFDDDYLYYQMTIN